MSAMKKALLSCCLLALGFAAQADDIVVPADAPAAAPAPASAPCPAGGTRGGRGGARCAPPHPTPPRAGAAPPRPPPITRWDYAGFSVFFEHQHVVDAVVPGRPPQIYHAEQLK